MPHPIDKYAEAVLAARAPAEGNTRLIEPGTFYSCMRCWRLAGQRANALSCCAAKVKGGFLTWGKAPYPMTILL